MDFLNKAYAQIADLFRTMTPGARITAGLLLVVVVVSLGYLFNSQISGPSADLMHGVPIPPNEMPKMLAAFDKANLNGAKIGKLADLRAARAGSDLHGRVGRQQRLAAELRQRFDGKAIESSSNPFMNAKERSMPHESRQGRTAWA